MSWVSRLLALLVLLPSAAFAQSNPVPPFAANQTLTAAQLNAAFQGKVDFPFSLNLGSGITGTLPVVNGGTGATGFTVSKPLVGNGTSAVISGTATGNTITFVTNTGTNVIGHCLQWDANLNAVDSGSPCGSSGGAVSSVFTRTGAVVAQTGDYTFAQISSTSPMVLTQLPSIGANTLLGALTATTPSALPVPSCGTTSNALTWTSGTGFGCNTFVGGGSVTSVSSGNFSPLFNVAVSTPTTAPAFSYSAINQSANLVFAGPSSGIPAAPTFRALVATDIPAGLNPGGTNSQIQFNNAGVFGGFTMSQDCTITTAGVITCTKTNNVAFANSATLDTTNASNISTGTLGIARLPTASAGPSAGVTQTIAGGTVALGTSAIASNACAGGVSGTVSVGNASNILTTDVVSASFNGDPTGTVGYQAGAMLSIIPYSAASNGNAPLFRVCNNTGSSITPAAITLNWRITR